MWESTVFEATCNNVSIYNLLFVDFSKHLLISRFLSIFLQLRRYDLYCIFKDFGVIRKIIIIPHCGFQSVRIIFCGFVELNQNRFNDKLSLWGPVVQITQVVHPKVTAHKDDRMTSLKLAAHIFKRAVPTIYEFEYDAMRARFENLRVMDLVAVAHGSDVHKKLVKEVFDRRYVTKQMEFKELMTDGYVTYPEIDVVLATFGPDMPLISQAPLEYFDFISDARKALRYRRANRN